MTSETHRVSSSPIRADVSEARLSGRSRRTGGGLTQMIGGPRSTSKKPNKRTKTLWALHSPIHWPPAIPKRRQPIIACHCRFFGLGDVESGESEHVLTIAGRPVAEPVSLKP